MDNPVRHLLGQLKSNLRNIEDRLSHVALSTDDYYRLAVTGPGHTQAVESRLIFWRSKLQQLIRYVEHSVDSGKSDALYMLELMQIFAKLTAHESFERRGLPLSAISASQTSESQRRKPGKESAREKRRARDDYIARRDAELDLEKFKGNRAVRISQELKRNDIPYSSESSVARILAKIHKARN
jgi:hypothetical protein